MGGTLSGAVHGIFLAGVLEGMAGCASPSVVTKQAIAKERLATYVFGKDPACVSHDAIIERWPDPGSPFQPMFVICYPAEDGRHVVLVQSATYDVLLGPKVRQGHLVYTSPAGIKVWTDAHRGPWLARILLRSARYFIKDTTGADLAGYILETPAGTFPALAINGKITDEELHALIDSLVPAKDIAQDH
jgi:hypothetical protein